MVFRINNVPGGILQAMPDGTSNSVIIVERYQNCDGVLSGGYTSTPGWGETTAFPDGDPLDDIQVAIGKVRWVMKAGQVLVDKSK